MLSFEAKAPSGLCFSMKTPLVTLSVATASDWWVYATAYVLSYVCLRVFLCPQHPEASVDVG